MPKIFEHFLNRALAHVIRFNSQPQHFQESVAEHSFYTAYFTSIIVTLLKNKKEKINEAKALKMALIHDMEEIFSGDILNPFKHYNKEVLKSIKTVSQKMIGLVFEDLPSNIKKEFIKLWKEESKQSSKEAQIVKTADRLALIAKCYEEIKVGNDFFQPIYDKAVEKLLHLDYPWWQKIKKEILPSSSV